LTTPLSVSAVLPLLSPAGLNPPLNITLIRSPDQLPQLSAFLDRSLEFVYDVETNVADAFTDRYLRTIQIGDRNEQYVIDLLEFAGSTERLMEQGNCTAPDWAQPIADVIRPALESGDKVKVGVNLEFDYTQTAWCLGVFLWCVYDCLLAEKVIHCGRVGFYEKGFWALDDLVARYAKKRIDKSQQTTFDLSTPLTEQQIQYAGLDVRLPLAVKSGQASLIAAARLCRTVQIENDAMPAFGDMHLNGMYLDSTAWLEILSGVEALHKDHVKVLDNYLIPVVGSKHEPPIKPAQVMELETLWRGEKDREKRAALRKEYQAANKKLREWEKALPDCEGEAFINYGSNPQLLQTLRLMGYGERKLPSTDDKVLATLAGDPVIDALRNYRTTAKQKSTYGKNWLEFINAKTGRVHPRINQIGAATGRASCTKPNLYNIPAEAEYRGAFRAPVGYVFITVDMAGAELRILAELSGEPLMVKAFANGWDVHSMGAEMIFGEKWKAVTVHEVYNVVKDGKTLTIPQCAFYYADKQKCECPGHKKLRTQVKALNFGIIYGKEAKSFGEELGISKEDAQRLLDLWRRTYKVAWAFLQKLGNDTKMTQVCRTLADRVRYFAKPDWDDCKVIAMERLKERGKDPLTVTSRDIQRVYHGRFGNIEREGKNTPHQGSNADIAKIAMGAGYDKEGKPYLWHLMRQYDAKLLNFVYDELDFQCREDQAEEFVKVVGDCIRRAGAELMSKVTMEYEANVSDRWQK
jgi:DNA polymerase-1